MKKLYIIALCALFAVAFTGCHHHHHHRHHNDPVVVTRKPQAQPPIHIPAPNHKQPKINPPKPGPGRP